MTTLKKHIQKFLPYIEDLRVRLYRCTLLFVIVFVGSFLSSAFFLKHLVSFFNIPDVLIATTSPFQFADVALDIAFFCGLFVTLPVVIFQLFSFIAPALTKRERGWVLISIPLSALLFVVGFLYGFFILYYSFNLLARINESLGIKNIWDIGSFLSQIFVTASLLGMVFQFPLVLTVLTRVGLIDITFLRQKRRIAYFGVFILVSLLPPTDGISLIAMALPLLLLYEVTILINFNKYKHVWIRN